jgi:UDP-glucose 4-epimerase
MKRVVVTGATGFVGANLARRLLQDGHEVHLLVRPGYKPWRIEAIRADARLHELCLEDASQVARIIGQIRPEWIFHLAAHGAYSSQTDLHQMLLTNIQGTVNLVTACLKTGFEAFVNTGSSSEYGFKDHPATETELLEPNSHYAVTKASATLFCRYTAQREQAPLTTLRLYSVYGPYEEPARLMPALIVRGLRGEWPPMVNPETARDYVHVDDVVEAHLLAAQHPSQEQGAIYNVGTGLQTTLREVVEVARRAMAIPDEPKWGSMPPRQWDTNCWVADSRLIRERLGWRPRYTFEEGFRQMLEWFGANPELRVLYEKFHPEKSS